jgi:hypothetical protein
MALFTTAKTWNQVKCPLAIKSIKKICQMHTIKYYPVLNVKETLKFGNILLYVKYNVTYVRKIKQLNSRKYRGVQWLLRSKERRKWERIIKKVQTCSYAYP